jgi:hypothetical protein
LVQAGGPAGDRVDHFSQGEKLVLDSALPDAWLKTIYGSLGLPAPS